jgi:RNA polymerase sigma factor (TIGR02999 family)
MEITALLHQAKGGDKTARDELFEAVYGELRRMARRQRRRGAGQETLNTTALVHEAYLKLIRHEDADWNDRGHFFAVAATAMRHILADYAEKRRAAKRGGGQDDHALDDFNPVSDEAAEDVLALHEALTRLEREHPRRARVVECRFYAGLDVQETASALEISPATVKRDWAYARVWLSGVLDVSARS